jgi:hypothetical protein
MALLLRHGRGSRPLWLVWQLWCLARLRRWVHTLMAPPAAAGRVPPGRVGGTGDGGRWAPLGSCCSQGHAYEICTRSCTWTDGVWLPAARGSPLPRRAQGLVEVGERVFVAADVVVRRLSRGPGAPPRARRCRYVPFWCNPAFATVVAWWLVSPIGALATDVERRHDPLSAASRRTTRADCFVVGRTRWLRQRTVPPGTRLTRRTSPRI